MWVHLGLRAFVCFGSCSSCGKAQVSGVEAQLRPSRWSPSHPCSNSFVASQVPSGSRVGKRGGGLLSERGADLQSWLCRLRFSYPEQFPAPTGASDLPSLKRESSNPAVTYSPRAARNPMRRLPRLKSEERNLQGHVVRCTSLPSRSVLQGPLNRPCASLFWWIQRTPWGKKP